MASIIPKRKANRQTEMKNTTQNRNALPVHSTGGMMKGNDNKAETREKKRLTGKSWGKAVLFQGNALERRGN